MKRNQWEVWHDTNWTEFETHSLIFGLIRKNLKGKYLVRGEYVFLTKEGNQYRPDISIFQIKDKGKPAELVLIVEVKKEGSTQAIKEQKEKYESLGVPVVFITGREGSNTMEIIAPYLN